MARFLAGRPDSSDRPAQQIALGDPNRLAKPDIMLAGDQIEEIAAFKILIVTPQASLGTGEAQRERAVAAPSQLMPRSRCWLAEQGGPYNLGTVLKSA
jgi:hypothetical protein